MVENWVTQILTQIVADSYQNEEHANSIIINSHLAV